MKYSVITVYGLLGMPLRCRNACFMCVVVTFSIPFSHTPVENPFQRCSANSEGCGRPSSQIVRFAFSNSPVMV